MKKSIEVINSGQLCTEKHLCKKISWLDFLCVWQILKFRVTYLLFYLFRIRWRLPQSRVTIQIHVNKNTIPYWKNSLSKIRYAQSLCFNWLLNSILDLISSYLSNKKNILIFWIISLAEIFIHFSFSSWFPESGFRSA